MEAGLHAGTVTFLFTDIEGSTALLTRLGAERYHDLLVEHERLLREAFEERGGRVVDSQGDGFFVAFGKARDAVSAAVAAQRALALQKWPEGVRVRVRMGIDTGEPVVGAGGYVGLGVHRTARIMAAGHGGQVLLSRTTKDLVQDELPEGASVRDLGGRRLKDLAQPVQLFQLVVPELPSRFPRLRTAKSPLRRPRVLVPAAALIVGGAVVAAVFTRGSSGSITVAPNSLAVIDAAKTKTVAQVSVGIRPGSVAVGEGSVWVANEEDKTLTRVDARTWKVRRTVPLSATPTGVAVGAKAVWIAEGALGAVQRLDPDLDAITATRKVANVRFSGGQKGSVTVGGGAVWVAFGTTAVTRLDPNSLRLLSSGFAGFSASAVAFGFDALWVANQVDNSVSRFSGETGGKIADINVGRGPAGVAVGGGSVWVADNGDNAVSRIDPRSRGVTAIPVGRGPTGVAYGAGAVWVANGDDGTVSRIDPASGKVVATIRVGGRPMGVAAAGRYVWVTVDAT